MERPIEFRSDGDRLSGVLHVPTETARGAVVCVNAGLQYRVGPHRLYVRLARRLCEERFAVLRFDLPGVGNSGGHIAELHYDAFDPQAVSNAVAVVKRETGAREVTAMGMCAGSRTVLRAAARDRDINAIVALSLPIQYFYPPHSATARYRAQQGETASESPRDVRERARSLIGGARSLRSWMSFLTLRADYGNMVRVMRNFLGVGLQSGESEDDGGLREACTSLFASGRRALFAYGEHDSPLIRDFSDNIATLVGASGRSESAYAEPFDYRVIPGGDHVFSRRQAQDDVIEEISSWLRGSA